MAESLLFVYNVQTCKITATSRYVSTWRYNCYQSGLRWYASTLVLGGTYASTLVHGGMLVHWYMEVHESLVHGGMLVHWYMEVHESLVHGGMLVHWYMEVHESLVHGGMLVRTLGHRSLHTLNVGTLTKENLLFVK